MPFLKRTGLGLLSAVVVTGMALTLGCGRERPDGGNGRETVTEDMTIPRCVNTADEAITLIRENHAKWLKDRKHCTFRD